VVVERKDESLLLDTITVIGKGRERVQELLDTLERFVGTLELVGERVENVTGGEVVWDDADYTTKLASALIGVAYLISDAAMELTSLCICLVVVR
jgi:hypothetical protein